MENIKYGYKIDLDSDSTAAKVIKLVGFNKKVLEFGCSYGYMSEVLINEFNCQVTGIEIDVEAANMAKSICNRVIVGDIEKIDLEKELKNEEFDVLIFADVLEHLINPWDVLEKARKFLKKDGYIVGSFPNIGYLSVALEILEGRFRYRPLGILDNTHLRFFTLETICEMFESCGYYMHTVQRTKAPLEISEFKTIESNYNGNLLNNIKSINKEWDTYQFIVIAYKAGETSKIKLLNERIAELEDEIKSISIELKSVCEENNDELKFLKNELENRNDELMNLQLELEEKTDKLNSYAETLEKEEEEINSLNLQIMNENKKIEYLETQIIKKDNSLNILEKRIYEQENIILNKNDKITVLEDKVQKQQFESDRIYNSNGWKMLLKYYKLRDRFLPLGSKRREIAKLFFNYKDSSKKAINTLKYYGVKGFLIKSKQRINSIAVASNEQLPQVPEIKLITFNNEFPIENENIRLSIIIPTKDAGEEFRRSISLLKNQKGFKNIQIIVIDSGSKDKTIDIARAYGANIIEIPPKQFSHSYARNLGAENADGDYLLFTTQDAFPTSSTWAYELYTVIKNNDVVAVSCAETPKQDADLFYRVICWNHYRFLEVNDKNRIMSMPDDDNHISLRKNGQLSDLANMISKDLFMKYKYRFGYAEDLDLGIRIIKDGYKIAFLSSTRVIHSHNREPYYFLKRGYVDSIFLTSIFKDFQIPYINPERYINDIIFTYDLLSKMINNNFSCTNNNFDIETIKKNIFDNFSNASNYFYPESIEISNNEFIDNSFKQFLQDTFNIYKQYYANAKYNGILVFAMMDFLKIIFEYINNVYESIDDFILNDLKACIFKAFAQMCGAHLAYCYLKNVDNHILCTIDSDLRKGV